MSCSVHSGKGMKQNMDITDFIRQVAQLEKEQDAIYRSVAAKERGAFLAATEKISLLKKRRGLLCLSEIFFFVPKIGFFNDRFHGGAYCFLFFPGHFV